MGALVFETKNLVLELKFCIRHSIYPRRKQMTLKSKVTLKTERNKQNTFPGCPHFRFRRHLAVKHLHW